MTCFFISLQDHWLREHSRKPLQTPHPRHLLIPRKSAGALPSRKHGFARDQETISRAASNPWFKGRNPRAATQSSSRLQISTVAAAWFIV
jgi:hypothetical protein